MNEVRILATATINLDTTAVQIVDMSAYSRYTVLGTILSDQVGAGPASLTVRGPDGAFILQPIGHPGTDMGWSPAKAVVSPVYPGGNITVQRITTPSLPPGSTVQLHIVGTDVP